MHIAPSCSNQREMSDPLNCIGCLVKRNLAVRHRNQDLAVRYVVVDEYDPDCEVYHVHNVSDPSEKFSVFIMDIELELSPLFNVDDPSEYMVLDNLDMKDIPPGSVVDFSHCSDPSIRGGKLFIRGSYKLVGVYTKGPVRKSCLETLLLGCVYVGAQNSDDIIEFVDIVFDLKEGSHNIICLRGTVVFQNCRFEGKHGIKVGSGNAPMSVFLVSCTFAYGRECSIDVESNAQVTMINTTMFGSKIGVSVKDGGSYTAHHCEFFDHSIGVVTSGDNATANLAHCTFECQQVCSLLVNSGKVSVVRCKMFYWWNSTRRYGSSTGRA